MSTNNTFTVSVKSEPETFDIHNGVSWGSVVYSTDDNCHLDELLKSFNLIEVKPYLARAEITFESLKYLSKEDIKEAIPPIGLRACFRAKLFSWRKNELSTMSEENDTNCNNMFQNSQYLTTLFHNSFSDNQNIIHAGSLRSEEIVAKFSKIIEPVLIRLTNEVTSLRQEIKSLRNEVKELKNEKTQVKLIMPENPFEVMDDFLNFEQQLQEDKHVFELFYGIDDETLSEKITNKVVSWLQNSANEATPTPTSSFYTPLGNSKLSKSLKFVLEECLKGKSIISHYEKNGYLTDLLRADLINIILEDVFYHHAKLSPKDMSAIVDEISENFPNEIREFYFIPRGRKANPGGKLWDKYVNQRSKRTRLLPKSKEDVETSEAATLKFEFDESHLLALKKSLLGDLSNWVDVKDKWQQTFLLRRKELKISKDIFEFLVNWPLYVDARSKDLINIDFELKYPNKKELLFNKWNDFTQKIKTYYYLHVKDKKSKEILAYSNDTTNQSSLDFIYTILLNSVILPTARFSNEAGKSSQKITIPDANESFVIHLNTIIDYEKAIHSLKEKYFSKGLTAQPFIIVVGLSIYNLEEFYLYFYNTLFKFDSFLQSLDICFKIMHILSLEYPKGCQGPWLFIQEYFYEIKLANDFKLSSIYQVINYLKAK